MNIQNVNIHLSVPAFGAALLSALATQLDDGGEAVTTTSSVVAPATSSTVPRIGEAWPGIDGIYAGVSRGEDGEPDAHLVLLNAMPENALNWQDAVEWAKGLGDGARLPTRFESALLYANVRDKLDTNNWHWTGTQYSSSSAWSQDFSYGLQTSLVKKAEGRCRAVRRLAL